MYDDMLFEFLLWTVGTFAVVHVVNVFISEKAALVVMELGVAYLAYLAASQEGVLLGVMAFVGMQMWVFFVGLISNSLAGRE